MSVYQKLRLGPYETRVLELLPSAADDDEIRCTLKVLNLNDAHTKKYRALSYTWGAPAAHGKLKALTSDLVCPIVCNGDRVYVTENLMSFLKQLRQRDYPSEKTFWVDAICINQKDAIERASQVRMMADIYSNAESVITWLGDEDEHTPRAFALLRTLSRLSPEARRSLHPHQIKQQGKQHGTELDIFADHETWVSIARAFQRTYFTRSWVIQEITLAKRIRLICGNYEIAWKHLSKSSYLFSNPIWKEYMQGILQNSLQPELFSDEWSLKVHSEIPAIMNGIRWDRRSHHWTVTLLYALIRSRRFKATDPRDKVYSLLGLVQADIADKPRLSPRYGDRTAAQVYIDVAIQLLEDSTDLSLLFCIEGELFQLPETGPLPSWVPDWSCEDPTGLRVTGYKRFSAAGDLTQQPIVDPRTLTLTLEGHKVDDITVVGEAKHEVIDGSPFPKWLDILSSLPLDYRGPAGNPVEHRLDAFWRTLICNTAVSRPSTKPPPPNLRSAFIKWFLERLSTGSWVAEEYISEIIDKKWQEEAIANEPVPKVDFPLILSRAKHMRLFRTAQGYLGLGTECVKEGDSVWIIPGSRVPLIMRQVKQDQEQHCYRLVGGTYLQGLMYGELLQSAGQDALALETLVIE